MPVRDKFHTRTLQKPKHGAPGVIADRGLATRLDSLGASVSIPRILTYRVAQLLDLDI